MQRCFRNAATHRTCVGPSLAEPLHRCVGRDRLGRDRDGLGLPSDDIPLLP